MRRIEKLQEIISEMPIEKIMEYWDFFDSCKKMDVQTPEGNIAYELLSAEILKRKKKYLVIKEIIQYDEDTTIEPGSYEYEENGICLLQKSNGEYCRWNLENIAELGGLMAGAFSAIKRPILLGFGGVAPKNKCSATFSILLCNFLQKVVAKNTESTVCR